MKKIRSGHEHHDTSGKYQKGRRLAQIALLGLLTFLPVGAKTKASMRDINGIYPEKVDTTKQNTSQLQVKKNIEKADELLFVNTVRDAFRSINSLKAIPPGGVVLKYNQTPKGYLPKTIELFPKEMKAKTLPFNLIKMGDIMFCVTPSLGFSLDSIYIDTRVFGIRIVRNTFLGEIQEEVYKTKEEELPEYFRKLWFEGVNTFYLGSSVREIPSIYQKIYKEQLDKINNE